MRENFDHFRQAQDSLVPLSEADTLALNTKVKALEMNLNIRDKEYENLRLDFTRLKSEFDKATTQNFSSDSEHGAVIDQLRSKTIMLIQKLEVLVNEISKTEKTSENTVNVLKRWIEGMP